MRTKNYISKLFSIVLGGGMFFIFSQSVYAQENLTLKDCYQLALKRSESIAINEQMIKETEGQFWQSLSGALPSIEYVMTQQWQDASKGGGSSGSNSNLRSIPSQRFSFNQTLFSGFKELAAVKSAKLMKKEKEERLERGKHLLFIDVSDAFYYFQTYQEDLSIVEGMHKALFERVEELRRRQKLGRTRDSEVSSAEASLYKVEADAQEVRSQLEVARQLLEFLIGQPVVAIKDEILPNDLVVSLEEFLSKVDQRPDVQAAQRALEGAKKNIVVARAGYWPTVTLDANSYVKRVGVSTGNDWDLMLSLNVPLFNGTQTYGLIKTAQAQEKQAELTLSQVKRSAVLDIQNAYTKFTIDLKRELAIKKAADAAERNYQLQALDYRNSLVSHLDVLQALQAFEERLRDYIVIKNQVKRYYWNLKVAVGEVTRDVI